MNVVSNHWTSCGLVSVKSKFRDEKSSGLQIPHHIIISIWARPNPHPVNEWLHKSWFNDDALSIEEIL